MARPRYSRPPPVEPPPSPALLRGLRLGVAVCGLAALAVATGLAGPVEGFRDEQEFAAHMQRQGYRPTQHRCNDRVEDFVQAWAGPDGSILRYGMPSLRLMFKCLVSQPGQEPVDPYLVLAPTDPRFIHRSPGRAGVQQKQHEYHQDKKEEHHHRYHGHKLRCGPVSLAARAAATAAAAAAAAAACEAEGSIVSTHRCCAERRLLARWVEDARRHGLRRHQIVTWVRRKVGPDITVWRYQKDGQLACATPCILCSRALAQFDMRVHCSQGEDAWYSGRMEVETAPATRPTAGQIRSFIRPQRDNQQRRGRVTSRKVTPQAEPAWLISAEPSAEPPRPPKKALYASYRYYAQRANMIAKQS